jgi:hypothetical protein
VRRIGRTVMKPITYSLQFRGRASSSAPDRMRLRLTAPSSALVTSLGPDGVHGAFEDVPGGDATLEAEFSLREHSAFDDAGTIEFGHGNSVRFCSLGLGRLVECPDRNLRHGTVVCQVEGGNGQFERAEGLITSNFLVSDTGEVTDNHLGLIFVHEGRSEAALAVRPLREGVKGEQP